MAKTDNKRGGKDHEIKKDGSPKKKRKRREVQVIKAGSDFPISARSNYSNSSNNQSRRVNDKTNDDSQPNNRAAAAAAAAAREHSFNNQLLDWNDTAHEIRSLGATGFVGEEKRNFDDEQYEQLTGRKKKKQHVPLPIARGIKKKAAERLERKLQEAKESGMVLPKSVAKKNKKKQQKNSFGDSTSRIHGPAPSVGFMKKGVLKVKRPS